MIFNRKKWLLIYKFFISQLFKIIYGNVIFSNKNDNDVKLTEINKGNHKYIFVEINNGRIFTDYVENVAIINQCNLPSRAYPAMKRPLGRRGKWPPLGPPVVRKGAV